VPFVLDNTALQFLQLQAPPLSGGSGLPKDLATEMTGSLPKHSFW
jgi:hypothetical protein